MSVHLPKSGFVGLLFAAAALAGAVGWALAGTANEGAGASSAAPAVLQVLPAAASAPASSAWVPGSTTSLTVGPAGSSGAASTIRSTTSFEQTPTGTLVGTSEADPAAALTGVGVPAASAVPAVPPGPTASTTSGFGPPATAPSFAPAPPAPSAAGGLPISVHAAEPISPLTIKTPNAAWAPATQGLALEIPPTFAAQLFDPLPGAQSRGVSFSEWESYRTDVAGRNILVTTDDSNYFKDRNGKLNGNTGDTDASGLNVTDATDSVIRGTESADAPPWEAVVQGIVDIATAHPTDLADLGDSDSDDDGDSDLPDPGANGPEDTSVEDSSSSAATTATSGSDALGDSDTGDLSASDAPVAAAALKAPRATPVATAAVIPTPADTEENGGSDSSNDGYDFPYVTWVNAINSNSASAVHTDEGTTLAFGQDALVIGADGYDDDDNRATGENITITRDDGNVVVGGTGDVNSQIGDSEQGAVIMGVTRTFVQGGGAY